jgi:hypothetical protein
MKKKTIEDARMLANKFNGICLSDVYENSRSKLKWKCSCGFLWETKYSHVQQGHWCPQCSGHAPVTMEKVVSLAEKYNGKCLSIFVLDAHQKLNWECCFGHRWNANYNNVSQGKWCPICRGGIKKDIEDVRKFIENLGGHLECCEYKNRFSMLKIRCQNGHVWETSYSTLKRGCWCTQCKWKHQEKLFQILKNIFTDHEIKYNFRGFEWLKLQRRMELDIFIPDLKLAIEYHGELHYFPIEFFGGDENFKKIIKRDNLKKRLINKNKKDVEHYIEFNYKDTLSEESVKNKLRGILPWYFRDTEIRR